jgi:hypothetical protein
MVKFSFLQFMGGAKFHADKPYFIEVDFDTIINEFPTPNNSAMAKIKMEFPDGETSEYFADWNKLVCCELYEQIEVEE